MSISASAPEKGDVVARTGRLNSTFLLACLCALAGATGCLQIETRITLMEDGSATITERLRFTRPLLDLAGERKADLLKLLTKDGALERMKHMGKGMSLIRHQLRDAEGGSKESLTEFKIKDFNEFRYLSPWPSFVDYAKNNMVAFRLEPKYTCGSSGGQRWAGQIMVHVALLKRPRGPADTKTPPPKPSPAEQQKYRELAPVLRDILKDFHVRLTFDSYSPVGGCSLGVRNRSSGATAVDLINFSSKDLDNWGGLFLRNEEVMLEVVRGKLAGPNITTHVRGYAGNLTLPVFSPYKSAAWFRGIYILIRPSRPLFDRYFKGKMLDYRPWTRNPPVRAEFNKIGWQRRRTKAPKKP